LLPPFTCQLSNCSENINGGFPGKAAVKEKVIVRLSLGYPPLCGFPDFSFKHAHKQTMLLRMNEPIMAVSMDCQSSALRLSVWLCDNCGIELFYADYYFLFALRTV
jgi:hypothetical protein